MPIDPSISLNAQVPNAMTAIGNMLNIGNQQVALQRAQQTLPYDVQAAQANAQGATANANVATQTQQPRISQAQAQNLTAQQELAQQKLKTLQMHVSNGAGQLMMLYGKGATPADVTKVVTDTMTNAGAPPQAIQQALSQIPSDPSQIDNFIVNKAQSAMGMVSQLASKFPAPALVNNNGAVLPLASGNAVTTGVQPGTIQGPATPMVLPPQTPVFNPQTGAMGYLGAQAGAPAQAAAGAPPVAGTGAAAIPPVPPIAGAPIQSGPAIGQKSLKEGSVSFVNNHFNTLQSNAAAEEKMSGIAQNIEDYADHAITGTAEDKLNFWNGLLAQAGLGKANDIKTATDLLQKNMSMFTQNTPAATDAKQLINILSQPHPTMSPQAIKGAAGQLVGQLKMDRDAANYFMPEKAKADQTGDTSGYMTKLAQFNKVDDPRVWQFAGMSPAGQAAFKARMSPAEQKQFGAKIATLLQMGFFQ